MNFPKRQERRTPAARFDNALTGREYALLISFIPIHTLVLPNLLVLIAGNVLDETWLTFVCYAISVVCTMAIGWRLLRRDYDPLFDHPLRILLEIIAAYFAMMALNICVSLLFTQITPVSNPNNSAVVTLFDASYGPTAAMSVFFAPIAEELMFRAGVFGFFSKFSRIGAYLASILLFSLYHVWSYALIDARNLIYIIQYIPVTFLLCRLYERTKTVWACIFFHMAVNGIALSALQALEQLM